MESITVLCPSTTIKQHSSKMLYKLYTVKTSHIRRLGAETDFAPRLQLAVTVRHSNNEPHPTMRIFTMTYLLPGMINVYNCTVR